MYYLYHSRKNKELEIGVYKKNIQDKDKDYSEPVRFNDCYIFCEDRKKLRDMAKNIKAEWINEFKVELEELNSIEIKNKYR